MAAELPFSGKSNGVSTAGIVANVFTRHTRFAISQHPPPMRLSWILHRPGTQGLLEVAKIGPDDFAGSRRFSRESTDLRELLIDAV